MPQSLDSADRKLLIGAGALFLALAIGSAIISPPQVAGVSSIPSSYSAAWDGTKAAYSLLEQLGYDVDRWQRSPVDLPSDAEGEVLILVDPFMAPSDEERAGVSEFIQRGGRVIVAGESATSLLPQAVGFEAGSVLEGTAKFKSRAASPLVRGAPEITMLAPHDWDPISAKQVVLYGNENTAAVVTYRFGRGDVIWLAAATPFTNGNIRDSSNLAFFLNCVGPADRVHVNWDEYFHGERGSLVSFFARTPVAWGAAQFGLVFLAILATRSRRLGPIRPPITQSRLSPLEFVETLGDLYASAHVDAAAVGIAYQRFRFTTTRKLGIPIDAPAAELARFASDSFGWDHAEFLALLERCEVAAKSEKAAKFESLDLVQELYDYSARLEVRRPNANERLSA
jgi:Domain of unknown function (DUF4350)